MSLLPAALSSRLAPYRAVLSARLRSQTAYRASFVLDLAGSLLIGLAELAEVWVLFHNIDALADLDYAGMLVVFGLGSLAFSLADLVVGHVDNLPRFIRAGTVEAFHLRPLPVLTQLMTSDLSLKRLSRSGVGVVSLLVGMHLAGVEPSTTVIGMVLLATVFGAALFAGLFVTAAGCQFWLINGKEMVNAFTYGGSYAAQQPPAIFSPGLKVVFGWIVPVVFVAYLPATVVLGLPGEGLFPAWTAWLLPVAAAWVWVIALLVWRAGVHHYQGAGG
ncbi:ABC-2 type transport system permease protein [Kytococcus aerolatus]|uniref:ABC-2 type transport system permease protein n=1 Tax=Kytococcus aerolatus TaxID=592308 RepID=A0A212TD59_9MICO|nr:ABC-2 family transporter protein [Kytococcus aerolatus]SNC63998.1 ABC-2 type transport system permease protein [Kytococcus aerolatus]